MTAIEQAAQAVIMMEQMIPFKSIPMTIPIKDLLPMDDMISYSMVKIAPDIANMLFTDEPRPTTLVLPLTNEISAEQKEILHQFIIVRTRDILTEHEDQVKRLASELDIKKTLTQSECRKIVENNNETLPKTVQVSIMLGQIDAAIKSINQTLADNPDLEIPQKHLKRAIKARRELTQHPTYTVPLMKELDIAIRELQNAVQDGMDSL